MRRSDRAVENFDDILSIIKECKVIRLAMLDGTQPYLVPLNFGWSAENGQLVFYCHSALEGRKIDLLRKAPRIAFEMDTEHALVTGDDPCSTTFRYASVMGSGTAEFLSGDQKLTGLCALMRHQTGCEVTFTPEQAQRVAVFAIRVDEVSAKRRK